MHNNKKKYYVLSLNSKLFGPQFISEENSHRRSNSRLREEAPKVQSQVYGKKVYNKN